MGGLTWGLRVTTQGAGGPDPTAVGTGPAGTSEALSPPAAEQASMQVQIVR